MFRRRRGRRAAWQWANNFEMLMVFGEETTVNPTWLTSPALLPAGRVQWLLEQQNREHCQLAGILLWMDVVWWNNNTLGITATPPTLDFYIIKSTQDESNALGTEYTPFQQPSVPASITEWNEDEDADGLDPYLWTHHLSPAVAGAQQAVHDVGSGFGSNSVLVLAPLSGDGSGVVQPNVNCRAAWQPDVHVRSRRRMARGDCLVLGMVAPPMNQNMTVSLAVNCRVLLK